MSLNYEFGIKKKIVPKMPLNTIDLPPFKFRKLILNKLELIYLNNQNLQLCILPHKSKLHKKTDLIQLTI